MKKVGIITFHSAHNYGAMLQAFALQKEIKLLNSNFDVRIINYRNKAIDNEYRILTIYRNSFKTLVKSIIWSVIFFCKNTKRHISFNKFMNNQLKLTESRYDSEEELKNSSPKCDYYIVGSDQVWNTRLTQGLQDSYSLNFGSDISKRISYAASIGNSYIEENEKNIFKNKLSKLDYISVREETAKSILEPLLNKQVDVVLDPTLLLEKQEWEKEIKNISNVKDKYIFAYRVGEGSEYKKIVKFLSEATGLKIIYIEAKHEYKNTLKNAYTEGPLEFVNYIKNAEYIVTNSFHATALSIIFNKNFFVIPHLETGSRVNDLLKKLNLSDRIFYNLKEFQAAEYSKSIDYMLTNKLLEKERKKSIDFLKNTLDIKEEIDN